MSIETGDILPDAELLAMGGEGPESHKSADLWGAKRVVIFGVPGAFTPTCSNEHLPGFIDNVDAIRAKGVDAIYCVTANDVFVAHAWAEATGADKAGITVLADPAGDFAKALGLDFTAPPVGLINRFKRFALVAEHGKVTHFEVEENPGQCSISSGSAVLDALTQ